MDHVENERLPRGHVNNVDSTTDRSSTIRTTGQESRPAGYGQHKWTASREQTSVDRTTEEEESRESIRTESEGVSWWQERHEHRGLPLIFFELAISFQFQDTTTLSGVALPPVDAYSQQTIRLSIVSEKIMTWSVIAFHRRTNHMLCLLVSSTCSPTAESKPP
jgi:hypothetical protein